jgi:alkanesulfonate monooxygenase SsuD/methylene tetrahydromethanopterin reductase-like flavin-dependent oxidoreductase (luciferase family)
MRIGFFDQLPCADWQSEQQRYQDILAQIALGDAAGFDTVWLGELHFSRSFSILADPLMILAAAAQRTTRIRLGTAVTLLPLHNPVKIAEQAATTDVLSNGRLEFGVGRGTAPIHYTGYNVSQEESRERFEEALEVIIQAWSHERFSYQGKYLSVRDLELVPRPVQRPYPPIRLAANSPDTFASAGQRGFPIFATPVINPPDKLLAYLQTYRENLPPGVSGDRAIAFSVHVAASRDQAREECEASLLHFFRTASERLRPLGAGDVKGFEAFQQALARMQRVRFEDIDQEMGVFGDPAYCVERIRELQRIFDIDEFICYFNQGGIMNSALVQQSMTRFANEVMPHCR